MSRFPFERSVSRRRFLQTGGAAVALVACDACNAAGTPALDNLQEIGHLRSRPLTPTEHAGPGLHLLRLGGQRDGFYSVPDSYVETSPAPLLLLLHGATQSSSLWASKGLDSILAERGVVVLAPDSRDYTWDLTNRGFGPDVEFIDRSLALVFNRCAIDKTRIAIGGFSDGASYALSLGPTNGDLFANVMAFSPGFESPATRRGHPRFFVSHGVRDTILPIDRASRRIVPGLRGRGYDVTYVEFDGGHTITAAIFGDALKWWLG